MGGYRLVRTLGGGSRGEVWLGRREDGDADRAADGPGPGPRLVSLKVFRRSVERASIDAEVEALTRVPSRHIMALVDLAEDEAGRPCLIGQRLRPGGLPQLLTERDSIAVGEAVTILAPIANTVAELHAAGVVHGGLQPSKVLFDDAGAPVLVGFGGAQLLTSRGRMLTSAQRDGKAGIGDDLARLATIARGVLLRTHEADSAPVAALADWIALGARQPPGEALAEELAERLFGLADPLPILVGATPVRRDAVALAPSTPRHAAPRLGVATLPATVGGDGGDDGSGVGDLPLWLRSAGLPQWLETILEEALKARANGALARMRAALAAVRRPFRVLAIVAILASAGAVVVPTIVAPGATEPAQDAMAGAGEGVDDPETPRQPIELRRDDDAAITGNDPVDAAAALLRARAACLTELSVMCLDGVDHLDSAAWEADRHAIRGAQESGSPVDADDRSEGQPSLIERMGDTAIVSLGDAGDTATREPASVLIIRTEAGWRIRDVLEG